LDGALDAQHVIAGVEIGPPEPQQFATAKSDGHRAHHRTSK
jgi:hypothetical protein